MDGTLVLLLLWGTMVGVDLIAGPQVMIARPIVAATVSGMIVGDVATGASVGLVLELFAWDVMPFGAARYPDYGVGAVVAVVTAAHAPGLFGLGVATGVGLVVAQVGDFSIMTVRRLNSADLARRAERIDAGEYAAIRNVHLRGVIRETLRAFLLVSGGLGLSEFVRHVAVFNVKGVIAATVAAVGVAVGVGFVSGLRISGPSRNKQLWYVMGVAGGVTWALLR